MGIAEEDVHTLFMTILEMRSLSTSEWLASWMKYEGFGRFASVFVNHKIDLRSLLAMSEPELRKIPELKNAGEELWDLVGDYKKFSSVEESFKWLRAHNFEKYSFHFGRYNIPFYALPFVNFFIINEMGGTIEDQQLLDALHKLKESPTYNAKAVTFWLRDLELETYSTVFAKNNLNSLELFSANEYDSFIQNLANNPADTEKLQTGINEMKEFQFYYTATSSMLRELGLEKYCDMFVKHGISIDLLPLMTDAQLIDIGVNSVGDRARILKAIKKINSYFPNECSNSSAPRPSKQNLFSKNVAATNETADKSVDDWLQFINGTSSSKPKNV
eukprot:CAMPEP_0117007622 /NCGR_PEP_ID=MMETSP0472-20121206/7444_1 /TAXON_ID=693140 ORGANISM="Tiarina fusus, Strain LIS" /NCGR_SAMPLE_ID=MMETSP0472 /ASSEMBLY_ACC=CAM_ASM_000603 /LENGTH=330 /DNA_ID=CAMNT_0004709459 /DNA_START=209 /DNA_END=1198 /DNA_ORIENTATION=-